MNDDCARQLISAVQLLTVAVNGVQNQLQSMSSSLSSLTSAAFSVTDIATATGKLVGHAEKVFEINLEKAVLRVLQEDNTRLNLELNKVQYEYADLKMRIIESGAKKQYEQYAGAIKEAQRAVPQGVPGTEEVSAGADTAAHTGGG